MHALRILTFLALSLAACPAFAAGVKVLFDPGNPQTGPFPTDALTAPATNTKTARRVRMPSPGNCEAQPNACNEALLASNLDGFHPQARVRVSFSGPISPATLKDGIYLVALENLTEDEPGIHKPGDIISLNQFVFHPETNTAFAKPGNALDQHRRYALIVTAAVKDEAGDPVEADSAFTACTTSSEEYCVSLAEALKTIQSESEIVAASVYTTLSATVWLEKVRDQLQDVAPTATLLPGVNTVVVNDTSSLVWKRQTGLSPSSFNDLEFPITLLRSSVRTIVFGSYPSPNYLGEDRVIPAAASAGDPPVPASIDSIQFQAFLPRPEKPEKGYPVVIYGHGYSDSRLGGPSLHALLAGEQGLATIAINAPGHGYGRESIIQFRDAAGATHEIPVPGRGVDLNNDGGIDSSEGCNAVSSSPLGIRDCLRQTTVDLLQLVRVLRAGLDVDGDGVPDFDPDRIYYAGQSLGAMYGAMLLAVDPNIQSAALNSGGGSSMDIARWSRSFAPEATVNLGVRIPSLLNAGDTFDESYPLRNQPVKVVTTPGAIEIQNAFETMEWLQAEGDPSSYVPHLKLSPLPGNAPKNILWQFAIGDATVPNPTQSALVRMADMKANLWIYRHDLARRRATTLDADPHAYLTNITGNAILITSAAMGQIIQFFSTGVISDPNGSLSLLFGGPVFEQPSELPEDLNFLEP